MRRGPGLGRYVAGWAWTGLSDDVKLWDWLEALALLPLAIATSTLWEHPGGWVRRHRAAIGVAAVAAAVVVLAGYLVPWGWTGFVGNTAWDWVMLLLLPVLLPTLLLPRLVPMAEQWIGSGEGGREGR